MTDNASRQGSDQNDGLFEPEGEPFTETRELDKTVMLVAGVAVGALIGAGAALLLAPASGDDTRTAIKRRVRKLTRRERGVWKSLASALEEAANEKAARSRLRAKKAEAESRAVETATS